MVFFDRMFASYYFLFLRLRKVTKSRIEDFQSMLFVIAGPILVIGALITKLQNHEILGSVAISKPAALIVLGLFGFIAYKYFLSNRERRNRIIDSFRELPQAQKNNWTAISILIIVIPLFVFLSQ